MLDDSLESASTLHNMKGDKVRKLKIDCEVLPADAEDTGDRLNNP